MLPVSTAGASTFAVSGAGPVSSVEVSAVSGPGPFPPEQELFVVTTQSATDTKHVRKSPFEKRESFMRGGLARFSLMSSHERDARRLDTKAKAGFTGPGREEEGISTIFRRRATTGSWSLTRTPIPPHCVSLFGCEPTLGFGCSPEAASAGSWPSAEHRQVPWRWPSSPSRRRHRP